MARFCSGPRAKYADILNDILNDTDYSILNDTDYSILNHTNYTTRCGDRPPCVALIVDDPTYDIGLNEGIVRRLARPIPGYVTPGIQIVYGDVGTEVDKAEKEVDKTLPLTLTLTLTYTLILTLPLTLILTLTLIPNPYPDPNRIGRCWRTRGSRVQVGLGLRLGLGLVLGLG